MGNKLKEITYLTIKNLKNNEIILPEKYLNTFKNFAQGLKLDLSDKESILKDLNDESDRVNGIVNKTNENLDKFYKSTTDAQTAIKNNDHASLEKINTEIDLMKEQINSLQKQLFSDPLTGAYNRKWLTDSYLENEIFQHDGFITFIDLDKFKTINDTFGHLVGDQVLKYLVKFLEKELKKSNADIVRYAGDEFLILFNKDKTTVLNVDKTMSDVQKKLSKQKLKSSKIDEIQFSFSYGVSPFKKSEYVEDVLNRVDEMMYQNKQLNR